MFCRASPSIVVSSPCFRRAEGPLCHFPRSRLRCCYLCFRGDSAVNPHEPQQIWPPRLSQPCLELDGHQHCLWKWSPVIRYCSKEQPETCTCPRTLKWCWRGKPKMITRSELMEIASHLDHNGASLMNRKGKSRANWNKQLLTSKQREEEERDKKQISKPFSAF